MSKVKQVIFVFGTTREAVEEPRTDRDTAKRWGYKSPAQVGNTHPIVVREASGTPLRYGLIKRSIQAFLKRAKNNPDTIYQIGCVGAELKDGNKDGSKHAKMAEIFKSAPPNCWFDEAWKPAFTKMGLASKKKFWGSYIYESV